MTDKVLCDNCGAPLAEEDGFCGDCGAPRPTLSAAGITTPAQAPEPSVRATVEPPPPTVPPRPARPRSEGGRTAAIVIAVLSALVSVGLCGFGLALTYLVPVQDATRQELLLGSTFVCFCPAALALSLALILWAVVIRRR